MHKNKKETYMVTSLISVNDLFPIFQPFKNVECNLKV